jgi:hypothetical protein
MVTVGRRFLAALLTTALALPAALLADDADAAASQPTVTSPRNGSLITGKTVRVRVAGVGKGFEALVGSRDVSKRFKPARGGKGVRIAVLRRGRDFSQGANRLIVESRGSADTVGFIGGRRVRGMLRLDDLGTKSRQAAIRVRGKVGKDFEQVRMQLNGKRVPERIWPRGRRSFEALLGADEGVRFGANKLVTTVVGPRGVYDRVTRSFHVARTAPLVGAGADRKTKAGRLVRLDGSATRSASGKRLHYAWKIVRRPQGSRATLRRIHSTRPLLRPDKRGVYKILLTATAGGNGQKASASVARASVSPEASSPAGSETKPLVIPEPLIPAELEAGTEAESPAASETKPPASVETSPAIDQVTVQAGPAVPPIGLGIQTIADGGGIEVGGKSYTTTANWVQVLLLDRATLEVKANVGFNVNESFELSEAVTGALQLNPNLMAIVSGGGRGYSSGGKPVNGFGKANAEALRLVFNLLGGDVSTAGPMPEGGMTLADGNWSIIGKAGTGTGSATQNHGMATGGDGELGSLTGYLQQDRFGNFAFVSPDNVSLDTSAEVPAPAGTNVIEVGGQMYQSQAIVAGGGGFQVLVLDGALSPVANQTFTTNEANGAPNEAGVGAMNAFLRAQVGGAGVFPANLVIVQSVGSPAGAWKSWVHDQEPVANNAASWGNTLAGAIGLLGGPAAHDQFAQMILPSLRQPIPSAVGGYTLIASTRLSDPFDDAYSQSQALSKLPSARVVGTISRNHDSQWTIGTPSSTPGFETGALAQVAFAAPTPFPLDTGAYLKASEWIAGQLGFGPIDVRTAYYEDSGGEWSALRDKLGEVTYKSGLGFTEAQFKELRTQLLAEFPMVAEVWKMITEWKATFGDSTFANYVNLQSIEKDIVTEINRQQGIENSQSSFDPLALLGSSLWMAQGIAGFSGQEEVVASLGVAAASTDLLDSVASQGPDGGNADAPIEAKASELGVQVANRYAQLSASLGQLGNLFVSDWGKLQQASRNSNDQWKTNTKVSGAVQTMMTRAAQASFYTALLPIAYGQYVVQWLASELNSKPWQDPWNYRCVNSHKNGNTEPFTPTKGNPASWMIGMRSFGDNDGATYAVHQVRLISTGIDWLEGEDGPVEHEPQVLPPSVSSTLFEPLSSETGLGLDQVRFFGNPAFQRWAIDCQDY